MLVVTELTPEVSLQKKQKLAITVRFVLTGYTKDKIFARNLRTAMQDFLSDP
jgi:hypothetical protein